MVRKGLDKVTKATAAYAPPGILTGVPRNLRIASKLAHPKYAEMVDNTRGTTSPPTYKIEKAFEQ